MSKKRTRTARRRRARRIGRRARRTNAVTQAQHTALRGDRRSNVWSFHPTFNRTYTRWFTVWTDVATDAASTFFVWNPQLSQFEAASAFVGVFEQYRILEAVQLIVPQANVVTPSAGPQPVIVSAVSSTDGTAPASATALDNYETVFHTNGFQPHFRRFKPNASIQTSSTPNILASSPWINLDNAGSAVPHYALKYSITGTNTAQRFYIYRYVKVTFTMAN